MPLLRRKLKVDLAELEDEKAAMTVFLEGALKVKVPSDDHKLVVDVEKLSPEALQRLVNKFIYHRHLNNEYWVTVDGHSVKVHKFNAKKGEKKKRTVTPSTIKHGW